MKKVHITCSSAREANLITLYNNAETCTAIIFSITIPQGYRPFKDGPTRLSPRLAPRTLARTSRRPCLVPPTVAAIYLPVECRPWATSSSASTSLHWRATSRWAHVATVCFMRFKCMLHMFYLDVSKVYLLHMLQWLYTFFFWQYAERVTSPTVSKISLSLGKLMSFSSD